MLDRPIAPAARWHAACGVRREGVFPIMYQAPFGAYVQEVLDPGSALHAFKPERVVIGGFR